MCDVIGKPREAKVKLLCNANMVGIRDAILKVEETSSCIYEVTIFTKRLCHLDYFNKQPKHIGQIVCNPKVVEKTVKEKNAKVEAEIASKAEAKKWAEDNTRPNSRCEIWWRVDFDWFVAHAAVLESAYLTRVSPSSRNQLCDALFCVVYHYVRQLILSRVSSLFIVCSIGKAGFNDGFQASHKASFIFHRHQTFRETDRTRNGRSDELHFRSAA